MEALVPELVAPGVLHPPAPWSAVDQVDAGQAHGVGERRLARHQPLGLRHRQVHPVQALVVVQGGVPDSGLLVPLLGDVAGEPHRLAVLDRGDRGGLEHLELGGDVILDRFAHHDVAAAHAVARVDRDLRARVVGHDHELLHPGDIALRELSRRERPDPVEFLVLIAVLPHELLGRGPQMDAQHPVNLLQGREPQRLRVDAVGHRGPQSQGRAPQQRGQVLVHRLGVTGRDGVRHGVGRDDPVLGHQTRELRPPAAVGNGGVQGVDDLAVIQGAVRLGDDAGEEGVGLLQLVVEEGEGLAQLQGVELELLEHGGAQHVEAGEGPAASRLLLVGDRGVRDKVGHGGVDGGHRGPVQGDLLHVRGGDGVAGQAGGGVGEEGGIALGDPGGVDCHGQRIDRAERSRPHRAAGRRHRTACRVTRRR